MKEKVILVHGYNKDKNDMIMLKENLEKSNYNVILIDLPLTLKKIEYASSIFKEKVEKIICNLLQNEKISLVGHSTGGLIIRSFLSSTEYKNRIRRAVLIATPNQGSELASIATKLSKTFVNVFKTLGSLHPDNLKKLELEDTSSIEIGAIAGNKNNLTLGKLLKDKNDGRVQVSSVYYDGLKDFIVVPYGHKDIHYKLKTAKLVTSFLKNGEFKKQKEGGIKNGF